MIVSFLEASTKMMERGWLDLGRAKKVEDSRPTAQVDVPRMVVIQIHYELSAQSFVHF